MKTFRQIFEFNHTPPMPPSEPPEKGGGNGHHYEVFHLGHPVWGWGSHGDKHGSLASALGSARAEEANQDHHMQEAKGAADFMGTEVPKNHVFRFGVRKVYPDAMAGGHSVAFYHSSGRQMDEDEVKALIAPHLRRPRRD